MLLVWDIVWFDCFVAFWIGGKVGGWCVIGTIVENGEEYRYAGEE